jgi:hypothetical protein
VRLHRRLRRQIRDLPQAQAGRKILLGQQAAGAAAAVAADVVVNAQAAGAAAGAVAAVVVLATAPLTSVRAKTACM